MNLRRVYCTEAPFEVLLFRGLCELRLLDSLLCVVHVGSAVNDTGLPDLQIHVEQQKISCNWRGMFDRLFGEEKAATKVEGKCPSDAFDKGLITPRGQVWAETELGFIPHYYLDRMDVCLLIARRGRDRRRHTAETETIIAKDFITEDTVYLSDLISARHRRESRTNYLSDWSEADTEQGNQSGGSGLGNQPSNTTEDSPSDARPLMQCEAKIEEMVAFPVGKDQIGRTQHVGSFQLLDPETAGMEAKLSTKEPVGEMQVKGPQEEHNDAAASLLLLAEKTCLKKG